MLYDLHSHQQKKDTLVNCYPNDPIPQNCFFSTGIHPWFCEDYQLQLQNLEDKLSHKNCLAVGECGLDRKCKTDLETQKTIFIKQIELANNYKKPLIIHCVKAFDLLQSFLKQIHVPVIIHGFNQNKNILDQLMRNDQVYVSMGSSLLNRGSNSQKALLTMDLSKLFFETDDNLDVEIKEIYNMAAQILGISIKELSDQISRNFERLF